MTTWNFEEAGWYTHPEFGGVCREIKGWYAYPLNTKAVLGPFKTMEAAKSAAEKPLDKGNVS